jgi:hypothetical protein
MMGIASPELTGWEERFEVEGAHFGDVFLPGGGIDRVSSEAIRSALLRDELQSKPGWVRCQYIRQ